MNSFLRSPSGPTSTLIYLEFFETSNYQDPSSSEGRLWASLLADVSRDPAWRFTLRGRPQKDDGRRIVLIIAWKSDGASEIPAWTSASDLSTPPSSSPLAPLLPLLASPPQILNLVLLPAFSGLNLQPETPPTDLITLYIPTDIDDTELATFGRQIHDFQTSFAHVSHDDPLEMILGRRGWASGTVERGIEMKKMMVHVLVHEWKSKSDEQAYKEGGQYEQLFLSPLREAERLGLEWELMQVFLEPIPEQRDEERKGRSCELM